MYKRNKEAIFEIKAFFSGNINNENLPILIEKHKDLLKRKKIVTVWRFFAWKKLSQIPDLQQTERKSKKKKKYIEHKETVREAIMSSVRYIST